jgi:hypothetical protein
VGGMPWIDMDYLRRHWHSRKGLIADEALYDEIIELARDLGADKTAATDALYDLVNQDDPNRVRSAQGWMKKNIHQYYP